MMQGKVILGLVAPVIVIGKEHEQVLARIDTGATSSSIDSTLAQKLGLSSTTKFKIVKSVHGVKKRPVVKVKIKMNGLTIQEEFNVADRSHMTYKVLIGQNILTKGNFLIDPRKIP